MATAGVAPRHRPRLVPPTSTPSGSLTGSSLSRSPSPHRRCSRHHTSRKHHRSHRHFPHHRQSAAHHHPPGSTGAPTLSGHLTRQITRGGFVDLGAVLADAHLVAGAGAHSSKSRAVLPITSLALWLQAWYLLADILTTRDSTIAPHLFRYQSFIVRTSTSCNMIAYSAGAWRLTRHAFGRL